MKRMLITLLAILAVPMPGPHLAEAGNPMCLCKFIGPRYSPVARVARIQGVVQVKVSIDPAGNPGDMSVLEEGHPLLQEAAIRALKNWRFCPPPPASAPHEITVLFRFRLDGNGTDAWAPTEITFQAPATVEIVAPPPGNLRS
jgi:TonB family protein